MKKEKALLLALLIVIVCETGFAISLPELFTEQFYSLHVPGRCGQNILKFVELAEERGIDLSDAKIINVNGGWIEPLFVRNGGYDPKVPGPNGIIYPPSPRFYYFHVFLHHEGNAYDFDFGNQPQVLDTKTYIKQMWLTGKKRDKYLGMEIYSVEDYRIRKSMTGDAPYLSMLEFLKQQNL